MAGQTLAGSRGGAVRYVPESSVGWLAFDAAEAERFRAVLEAFNDPGTLDPVGIGSVRDAIGDQLFPGISTIQTRARYFLFEPRIFRSLEAERVDAHQFRDRLRRCEIDLIYALVEGGERFGEGVIGGIVRDRVVTLPSTIYWNGMGTFGIRRFPGSGAEYRRGLPAFYRSLARVEHDDDGQPIHPPPANWDPDLPNHLDRPHGETTFDLTAEEADYLTERMRRSEPDSLLSVMLAAPGAWTDAQAPWHVPIDRDRPGPHRLLEHAERSSFVLHSAQLLYNLALAERARDELGTDRHDGLIDRQRDRLDGWAAEAGSRRAELRPWASDLGAFWTDATRRGARVPTPTRAFVEQWATRALDDPHRIADADWARALVRHREHQLKGSLAKLNSRPALEAWSGQPQSNERLEFRWSNARQIADDIVAGRERR